MPLAHLGWACAPVLLWRTLRDHYNSVVDCLLLTLCACYQLSRFCRGPVSMAKHYARPGRGEAVVEEWCWGRGPGPCCSPIQAV